MALPAQEIAAFVTEKPMREEQKTGSTAKSGLNREYGN
jgi:hypothetical protein